MITKQTPDLSNAMLDDVAQNDRPAAPEAMQTRKRKGRGASVASRTVAAERVPATGPAPEAGNPTSRAANAGRAKAIAAGSNTASTADAGSDAQAMVTAAAKGAAERKKKAPSATKTEASSKVRNADIATGKAARGGGATRNGSKTEMVLYKLRLARGASIEQLAEVTGWQAHSVRGFLSAVVRKKMSLNLTSETGKDGVRRYRIADGPVN